MPIDPGRIKNLFSAALDQPDPAARQDFLERECAGDAELRQRLEVLLNAHDAPASVLNRPLAEIAAESKGPTPTLDQSISEFAGTVIGPYKLIERIGEGGMGTVWMAQQTEPVKRLVALKLIKAGMDSRQVIARFEAERQALALMDHPNIAKVLDAGTTSTGRPYFVMDLVKGVPITKYCDEHHLTPRQRLELFIPVCQAVQHAHQKGVIHRDLKPSNVLVALYDGKPVPKVIDFGVAKAAGQSLTEKTLITGFGAIVGTLEYMSPEQAEINQLDIDTRSDIYSLGVVLYELLTGSTPFTKNGLEKAGMLEMLRLIREEEPSKPSTKLSTADGLPTLAANRGTEPAKLTKLVRGELDWIVMKAIEKDRSRRYETANGFALDVQRYLADEPVQACPPSAWYRFRKFGKRNKGALLAGSGLGLGLLVGLGAIAGSIGWATRDREARQATIVREADLAQEESERFLSQKKWPEALAAARRGIGLLASADVAAERRQRLLDLETDLRMVLRLEEVHGKPLQPDFFDGMELDAGYAKIFREYGIDIDNLNAGEAAERLLGKSVSQELAMALDDWAGMRKRRNRDKACAKLLEIARATDPDPWRRRFRDAWARGDRQELEKLADAIPVNELPPGTLLLLGSALNQLGAVDKGMALLQTAQQRYPDDLWLNDALACGNLWGVQPPRHEEALRFYTAALAARPGNYRLHIMVGILKWEMKQLAAAVIAYSRAIELAPNHFEAWARRADCYSAMGHDEKAKANLSRAIELEPAHPYLWYNRGRACHKLQQYHKAIADYREAIRLKSDYAEAHNNLGLALKDQGQLDEAFAEYQEALRLKPALPEARTNLAAVHFTRGDAFTAKGRMDEAIAQYRQAIRFRPECADYHFILSERLRVKGQLDDAIAELRETIRLQPDAFFAHNNLGAMLLDKGKLDDAAAHFREAIRLKKDDVKAHVNLGLAFGAMGQLVAAVAEYREAIRLKPDAVVPLERLAWILATNADAKSRDPTQAIELAKKAVALEPRDGRKWNTLGVAHYRAGSWEAAIAALEKSLKLQGENCIDYFFLAMARWQQGIRKDAHKWYDQAVQCMEKNQPRDEELKRFRQEAEKLLELKK